MATYYNVIPDPFFEIVKADATDTDEGFDAALNAIKKCAYTFSNGITVVNTTRYDITFLDTDEACVIIPSDKACILNAKAVEKRISEHLVTTEFVSTKKGELLLDMIFDTFDNPYIIGITITMSAYSNRIKPCFLKGLKVGMIPIPEFLIYKSIDGIGR